MHPLYHILARAANRDRVNPGEFIVVKVDLAEINDLYLQVILSFKEMGGDKVWNPRKITFVMDHYAPAPTVRAAENQRKMREFARKRGIKNFFDINQGICHQVMPEAGLVWPGMLLVAYYHSRSFWCFFNRNRGYGYGSCFTYREDMV
jgi:3-isopropylmalate/(R)-2-methylmalate dehydratase large subunit